MNLNPGQQKVVEAKNGPILVLAGAGTGKTRTLTARATKLLQNGLPPHQLLLLTFTNKAADEMKERMSEQIGALAKKIWAGTFHSIASRILHQHATLLGFSSSFSILDEEDSKSLLKRCLKNNKLDKVEGFPKPRVVLSLISKAANTGRSIDTLITEELIYLEPVREELKKAAKLYAKEKKEMDSMDFDDLLEFWVRLLKEHETVKRRYSEQFQHILVDEYQDTNHLQNEAIKLLATKHGNITAVGDDHQSIYAFRGAQFKNILEFEEDWPGCQIFTIEQNYRSSPEILTLANASIANNVVQRTKNLFSENRSQGKPLLKVCQDTSSQAKIILQDIQKMRYSCDLTQMAILYRAHFLSMEIQIELAKARIPFRIRSGVRFFEMAHIKDVLSFLKWTQNPKDKISFSRFMGFCPGIGAKTSDFILKDFLQGIMGPVYSLLNGHRKIKTQSQETFELVKDCVKKVSENKTPSEAIQSLITGSYRKLLGRLYEEPEKRLEDLHKLSSFAEDFQDLPSFLEEVSLYSSERDQDNKKGIILTTIHQAKGLEWDTVYLPGLYQGGLPNSRAQSDSEVEEERRLFYVAVTRAKKHLQMYYPRADKRMGGLKPSMFLTEIQKTGTFGMVKAY